MTTLITNLSEVKNNLNVEIKKIYELDARQKYRITFAKMFKTKYGNSVLLR